MQYPYLQQQLNRNSMMCIEKSGTPKKKYIDQIGQFPILSSKGSIYMMVMVEIDSSYIDAEPMNNRTEDEIIKAYQKLLGRIKSTGVCNPKKHMLDNEASNEYKKVIKEQSKLQLVPPDNHRSRGVHPRFLARQKSVCLLYVGYCRCPQRSTLRSLFLSVESIAHQLHSESVSQLSWTAAFNAQHLMDYTLCSSKCTWQIPSAMRIFYRDLAHPLVVEN